MIDSSNSHRSSRFAKHVFFAFDANEIIFQEIFSTCIYIYISNNFKTYIIIELENSIFV